MTNHGQANNLFRNDGANEFVDVAVGSVLADTGHGRAAPWADYDNDEDLDIFLANEGDPNKLFRNDGAAWLQRRHDWRHSVSTVKTLESAGETTIWMAMWIST